MSALEHEIDRLIDFYDSFKTASAPQSAASETETDENARETALSAAVPASNVSLLSYEAGTSRINARRKKQKTNRMAVR
jgi:hypothetical protein